VFVQPVHTSRAEAMILELEAGRGMVALIKKEGFELFHEHLNLILDDVNNNKTVLEHDYVAHW
jgi:hypothetical protein